MGNSDISLILDHLGRHKVSLVLQGHDHYREDLTYGNVRYTDLRGTVADNPKYQDIYTKLTTTL